MTILSSVLRHVKSPGILNFNKAEARDGERHRVGNEDARLTPKKLAERFYVQHARDRGCA